jgi:hypothetical protein
MVGLPQCRMHVGRSAENARRSASERLAALVEPSFDAMQRALKCRDMNAVVRAATNILDRAGVRPDTHSTADVSRMLRAVAEVVMANVSDPGERAAIARELHLLSRRFREPGLAVSVPAAPRPALPVPPPEPERPVETVPTEVVL